MHNSCRAVQVLNCIQHLRKVVSSEPLREASFLVLLLDEGEEVTLFNELKNNKEDLYAFAILLDHCFALDVVVEELNDVLMANVFEEFDLVAEDLLECLEIDALNMVTLDNLYCQKSSRLLVLSLFNST